MPTNLEKEWAAVDGEEVIEKRNLKKDLLAALRAEGLDPDDYEIVALPLPHWSMLV